MVIRNILYIYDSLNKAFQVISKFLSNRSIHPQDRHTTIRDTLWSVVKVSSLPGSLFKQEILFQKGNLPEGIYIIYDII